MATLLLTAVGTAVAGPIGGAVGAVLGQAADQALFAPKARRGPRLGDLTVQTSHYGADIPKLFGAMRVAGTVIWATDIVETRSSSGGGKGRPRTTGYSYSANFAVALSARPLRAVHRIWADGKLLRGAAGDFKTAASFRFHDGDEDQAADPLIASIEGELAPCYRGLAYAVFEGLQLADFGNRIPSLTFEVEADPGPVTIGSIASEIGGGTIVPGETPAVHGYAVSGDSVRTVIAGLLEAIPLLLVPYGKRLLLGGDSGDATLLARDARIGQPDRRRRAPTATCVTLSYYDVERDYQGGTQRAARPASAPKKAIAIPLAAALSAGAAKRLAEARLDAEAAARSIAGLRLGWEHLALRPGMRVRLEGEGGTWSVRRWQLGPAIVDIDLARVPDAQTSSVAANPGRSLAQPDLVHGPTTLCVFEAPLPGYPDAARLFAAAAGTSRGWRRAALLVSSDGGVSWEEGGHSAEPAILGQVLTALPAASAALFDCRSGVDVELLNDGMWLESRSDSALGAGANLALLGSELVQFGRAEQTGERRFRLSRLLRGRLGSEWAVSGHASGEPFLLIDPQTLTMLPMPMAAIGATVLVAAVGLGDPIAGVRAERPFAGEALRPLMPCHLVAATDAAGDLSVTWARRSRAGFELANGRDVPLGEEQEKYLVSITAAGGARSFEVSEQRLLYPSAELAADAIAPPLTVSVAQIGTYATSRPAVLVFG